MRVLKGQKAGEKGGKGGSLREEAKKTETGAGSQEPETVSQGKMCGGGRFHCSPCLFALALMKPNV